ncbi:nitroreductase family protein [Maribacter polysiphoniae]|uniref:nitroreductase family protein n=1 Tax=Maribacter polysiphoniae TaxID=429344 RepID=UPI00235642C8|nr:nitroreductase family protein [Maribacter polysiphoniae]
MEKTVTEAITYRRSVRIYKDDVALDDEKVKQCLVNASLAPTSSNMQLWEFYHVTDKTKLKALAKSCFDQPAAKTAQQLVVVVTRKDLWRKRSNANLEFLKKGYGNKSKEDYSTREKFTLKYYSQLIPTLYMEFLGIFGALKYVFFQTVGLFRPIYRQVRNSDMRIVVHKSAALAAENFMVSMAAIGYDTCPMEGSDTLRVKKILNLPRGAEINMIIGCGLRDDNGVYGPRFRIPFEEVYHKV